MSPPGRRWCVDSSFPSATLHSTLALPIFTRRRAPLATQAGALISGVPSWWWLWFEYAAQALHGACISGILRDPVEPDGDREGGTSVHEVAPAGVVVGDELRVGVAVVPDEKCKVPRGAASEGVSEVEQPTQPPSLVDK